MPGVVGSLQAVEALKLILGIGEPLVGRLLQLDLENADLRIVTFDRRADCASCNSAGGGADRLRTANVAADIEPGQLAQRLTENGNLVLLDIREPWEWSLASIGDPRLLPMGELEERIDSLDRSVEMVVYCHHGMRSDMAAQLLRRAGAKHVRNLVGGIDRWSAEVDPRVPRY